MIFCSTHTRLTRTSSDLRILSGILSPPSPVLKPDDLLISLTSGEIPIILGAAVHACDSTLFDFVGRTPGLGDVAEELKLADKYDATGNTRVPTGGSKVPLKERMWEESDALYVAAGLSNPNGRCVEYPSNDSSPGVAVPKLKDVIHAAPYSLHDDEDDRYSNLSSNCLLPTSRRQGNFLGLRDSQASPSTMEVSTATAEPKEDLDGDCLEMIATLHTYATLPTPTFAPPSQSADVISPVSSPNGQPRHRRPLERARAVRFPGRPRSPRLPVNEIAYITHNANRQTPHARWQLLDSATPTSTSSCPADSHVPDAAYPKPVALPEELSWLQNMIIELWIDQEGFRAVRPCMQLIGYSPRTRSLHPYEPAENAGTDVTAGVAEFMPTKREMFIFHYAALDSAPTLRMVSVAGDDSRDFISKQATLSVKANGVYTVLGTETLITSVRNNDAHGIRLQNARLRWKFDYLVTDRKADATGKTLPGEKTLTPLTFSCSPYLFHPYQGKKAGLMHTMKKNLIPKLGSQKLEPPTLDCVTSHDVVPQVSHHSISTGSDTATHTRSRSDVSAKGGHYSLTRSPLDNGIRGVQGMSQAPGRGRRRRASSAGENRLVYLRNERGVINTSKEGVGMPGHSLYRL